MMKKIYCGIIFLLSLMLSACGTEPERIYVLPSFADSAAIDAVRTLRELNPEAAYFYCIVDGYSHDYMEMVFDVDVVDTDEFKAVIGSWRRFLRLSDGQKMQFFYKYELGGQRLLWQSGRDTVYRRPTFGGGVRIGFTSSKMKFMQLEQ